MLFFLNTFHYFLFFFFNLFHWLILKPLLFTDVSFFLSYRFFHFVHFAGQFCFYNNILYLNWGFCNRIHDIKSDSHILNSHLQDFYHRFCDHCCEIQLFWGIICFVDSHYFAGGIMHVDWTPTLPTFCVNIIVNPSIFCLWIDVGMSIKDIILVSSYCQLHFFV